MARHPRKSSACVTLVLIGAAALSGCGDRPRTAYATKEACVADWGDPKDCEVEETQRADGTRARSWWGPSIGSGHSYSSGSRNSGSRSSSSSSSSGSHSISRGGFGSHGSSAS